MRSKLSLTTTTTILLIIVTILTTAAPVGAAPPSSMSNKTVNGKSAAYVSINLKDKSVKPALLTAKGNLASMEQLSAMSDAAGVFAAINGTPFVSTGGLQLPDGALIKDGKLIHIGNGVTVGITAGGRLIADKLSFDLFGYINGELKAIPWGINHLSPDNEGITVFTPEFGAVVPVVRGGRAVIVVDGKVSHITASDFIVPDGGFALLYNPGVVYMVEERYKIGDRVSYDYLINTTYTKPKDWDGVNIAVGAGIDLILSGEVTAGRVSDNVGAGDASKSEDRTFLGGTDEGAVTLGMLYDVNLEEAAMLCRSLGLKNAVCMRGTASTALYFKGTDIKSGSDINNSFGFADISGKSYVKEPAYVTAAAKDLKISVKESLATLHGYNVEGYNYFMLRDVAFLLKDTEHKFGIDWDGASKLISLGKGRNYVSVGSELKRSGNFTDRQASAGDVSLVVNGAAYSLNVFNFDGNNYFRLRDLGAVLGFPVDWNEAAKTIIID